MRRDIRASLRHRRNRAGTGPTLVKTRNAEVGTRNTKERSRSCVIPNSHAPARPPLLGPNGVQYASYPHAKLRFTWRDCFKILAAFRAFRRPRTAHVVTTSLTALGRKRSIAPENEHQRQRKNDRNGSKPNPKEPSPIGRNDCRRYLSELAQLVGCRLMSRRPTDVHSN